MGLIVSPNQEFYQYQIEAYQAMGSVIKAYSIGVDLTSSTGTSAVLTDAQIRFSAIWLAKPALLTGVAFYQTVQGSYTADQNNKVGLYSYSGGNLTLVASSANNGNLYKSAAQTLVKEPFSAQYPAIRGLYFTALIHNQSAQVTAAQMASGPTASNANKMIVDFTNSAKAFSVLGSQTDLPAGPTAMSGLTSSTNTPWTAVY